MQKVTIIKHKKKSHDLSFMECNITADKDQLSIRIPEIKSTIVIRKDDVERALMQGDADCCSHGHIDWDQCPVCCH